VISTILGVFFILLITVGFCLAWMGLIFLVGHLLGPLIRSSKKES